MCYVKTLIFSIQIQTLPVGLMKICLMQVSCSFGIVIKMYSRLSLYFFVGRFMPPEICKAIELKSELVHDVLSKFFLNVGRFREL